MKRTFHFQSNGCAGEWWEEEARERKCSSGYNLYIKEVEIIVVVVVRGDDER
jgi:hypothetical protein